MAIERREAPTSRHARPRMARQPATRGCAPLYIVCSPCRCVGKTLVSRLLTEFHAAHELPVAAFDLADEGPQLTDYLPQVTSDARIGDIRGQIDFFERLIGEKDAVKVVDLSHRAFTDFFTVVETIGFFEEARRQAITPHILFIVTSDRKDRKAPQAYADLQARFADAVLLPVRNGAGTSATWHDALPQGASAAPALRVPLLTASLRELVYEQTFSFRDAWHSAPADLPDMLDEALRDWMEGVFSQFRGLGAGFDGAGAPLRIAGSRQAKPRMARRQAPAEPLVSGARPAAEIPDEVRKYAPKKKETQERHAIPMDQLGDSILAMLNKAAGRLHDAQDQVGDLEAEIERVRGRATRAESWLQRIGKEVEHKLAERAASLQVPMEEEKSKGLDHRVADRRLGRS